MMQVLFEGFEAHQLKPGADATLDLQIAATRSHSLPSTTTPERRLRNTRSGPKQQIRNHL